jgi:hypothetical protein
MKPALVSTQVMKKIIILSLFLSNYVFGQSVTILPDTDSEVEILKIRKNGKGLDHRSPDGTTGIGTYVFNGAAFIQTHTAHPLIFTTNNGNSQMTVATNGNVGIGTTSPSQKLHVIGNGHFAGSLVAAEDFSAGSITIGGGNTINKIFKTVLTEQSFFSIGAHSCATKILIMGGVNEGDTVMLNVDLKTSTIAVGNVWASGNGYVSIRFCNIGNASNTTQEGLTMSFTVIK